MSDKRLEVIGACMHGRQSRHVVGHGRGAIFCPGGPRRVLTFNQFQALFCGWFRHQDLVSGATGTWKSDWTAGLANSLLDVISGANETTTNQSSVRTFCETHQRFSLDDSYCLETVTETNEKTCVITRWKRDEASP